MVCGGTGGHVYPALAVAEQFSKDEIFFLGTQERLEAQLVAREGYLFHAISAHRKNPLPIIKGVFDALKVFLKERPGALFATGGYVTIPAVLAALILRIPIFVQEQNALPGKVNRFIAMFARKVFIAFPEATRYFHKSAVVTSGNPLRQKIVGLYPQHKAKHKERFTVLVLGGSLGAEALDKVVAQIDWQALQVDMIHLNKNNYVHDMAEVLQKADLAVCRAGALTLAELAVAGVPAILIPYPYAAEKHQDLNAQAYAAVGAAQVIDQTRLSPPLLTSIISALKSSPEKLTKMSEAMQQLAKPNASTEIAKVLRETINA